MIRRIALFTLALPLATISLRAQGLVSTAASRDAVLESASRIATPAGTTAALTKGAVDPFNPPAANLRWDVTPDAGTKSTGLTDEQLAKALIDALKPTGSIQLGGEPYLLFTERRQKIGDKLLVTLDRVEYVVEIVSIANNRFRIRYNGQDVERSIK
ncbi:MAG TPA: hypothetical protein VK178_03685 [Opitutaceae bacterium]|nr:hypothetical protein [Opitutaceae bacterium]